jgi:hypothetical protein
MSKSNAAENKLLLLLFNATAWADLAENDASSPATSLYVSLHTSDPGEAGAMNTNEAAYTNYARVAVARTSGGWTVSTNTATNAAEVAFPECGVTGATVTHFGIGLGASGATELLYSGALAASRAISAGITPRFLAGEIDVTED